MNAVPSLKNKYKPILVKNIVLSFVAYHIGLAITLLAMLLEVTSLQPSKFYFFLYLIYIPHIALFIYVARAPDISKLQTNYLLAIQMVWWLVVFCFWDFYLAQARPLTLILGFFAIHYLFLYARFIHCMLLCIAISVIHLSNSYIGINYYGHQESFALEALLTLSFFCASTLIGFHSTTVSAKVLRAVAKDDLTKLYNRRYFNNVLAEEFNSCHRYGHPSSLLLMDMDAFKAINDRYGHSVGDKVLVAFAQALRASLRECDYACRWGGEEFLVVLPHTDKDGATAIATRLLKELSRKGILKDDVNLVVTFSGGIALLNDYPTPEAAINQADKLMYQAKHQGRNQIISDQPQLQTTTPAQLE